MVRKLHEIDVGNFETDDVRYVLHVEISSNHTSDYHVIPGVSTAVACTPANGSLAAESDCETAGTDIRRKTKEMIFTARTNQREMYETKESHNSQQKNFGS